MSTGDFSISATRRAVFRRALYHPVTVACFGVGVLGLLMMLLSGMTGFTAAAAMAGFGLSMFSFFAQYFVFGKEIADRHVRKVYEQLEKKKEDLLESLIREFRTLGNSERPALRDFAAQGGAQYRMVRDRFNAIKDILKRKLDPSELTYERYLGAAEQVYLAVLDNLESVITGLQSVEAIDLEYIEVRLQSLKENPNPSDSDWEECRTLEERKKILEQQLEKIDALLSRNEVAITEMDKVNTSVADLKVTGGRSLHDLDSAIREMEQLARRVHEFN